ncbi:MAG: alpha/beta hydrolase [Acidobacteriota bacterium]|nr:alpha/beta hydrolase [Acidobacteriota bacterium]
MKLSSASAAGNPECAKRFPNIVGRLASAARALDAQPIPREGGRITGRTFLSALWAVLVRTTTLPFVPLIIDQAASGNRTETRQFVEAFTGPAGASFGDYSHGQYHAVTCFESLAGRSEPSIREAIRRYPYLVGGDELADARDRACDAWQPERAPVETFTPVRSKIPVLLMAGEFDPATPPEDAFQAARFLSSSTIVMVSGASHAPMNADECTRGIALAFLATPSARPDLGCLQKRPLFRFKTDGLEAFLDAQTKR